MLYCNVKMLLRDKYKLASARIFVTSVIVWCSPITTSNEVSTLAVFLLNSNSRSFSPVAQQPLVGQGLPIIEASRSHSDTPHSVGLPWISDQPDAETSLYLDNTQHSQETDIHAPGGIRARNPSKQAAEDPRLRPRGHWDRQ